MPSPAGANTHGADDGVFEARFRLGGMILGQCLRDDDGGGCPAAGYGEGAIFDNQLRAGRRADGRQPIRPGKHPFVLILDHEIEPAKPQRPETEAGTGRPMRWATGKRAQRAETAARAPAARLGLDPP